MSTDRPAQEDSPSTEGGSPAGGSGAAPAPGSLDPSTTPAARPSSQAPGTSPRGPVCEICGTVMYDRHCKIVCPGCGYLRDCSDP